MQTQRMNLVLQSIEEAWAQIEAMSPDVRAQLSEDWLARLRALTAPDPWTLGYKLVLREGGAVVGTAGFKGPPADGMVEIAYGLDPEHQGRGYATEAAQALTEFALASKQVRVVRAHTLPEPNPSSRVLTRCGFRWLGEVIEPDDGLMWRWEKTSVESPGANQERA